MTWDFRSGSVVKTSPVVQELQETRVSIPGSGRPPGEGNGNPLQCSCLENPMDRGAWQATVHGVTKSWTRLQWLITRVWANFLKCFLFSSEFLLFSSPPVSPHSVSEHKRFQEHFRSVIAPYRPYSVSWSSDLCRISLFPHLSLVFSLLPSRFPWSTCLPSTPHILTLLPTS